jgi:hypothetical protein
MLASTLDASLLPLESHLRLAKRQRRKSRRDIVVILLQRRTKHFHGGSMAQNIGWVIKTGTSDDVVNKSTTALHQTQALAGNTM